MKKSITQQDDMGCGAACVSFITGNSYEEVLIKLGKVKASTTGFTLKELRLALYDKGYSYQQKHINHIASRRLYSEGIIVFIARSSRYPVGHYLVRHQGMWMDPWINHPNDKNLIEAKSGFRRRLPGKAQWVIFEAT